MMNFINNKVFGIGLLFLASVIPAQATLFTFTGTAGSGSISFANNTAGSLVTGSFSIGLDNGFSSIPTYSGKPTSLLGVFLQYNASAPSVINLVETGTNYAGITAGTTLLTINLSSALSLNATLNGVTINATGFTNTPATTTFFNDLGLDGAAVASNLTLTSIGLQGTLAGTGTSTALTTNSDTLGISTPEPGTYMLLSGGLALVGVFSRKRLFARKSN